MGRKASVLYKEIGVQDFRLQFMFLRREINTSQMVFMILSIRGLWLLRSAPRTWAIGDPTLARNNLINNHLSFGEQGFGEGGLGMQGLRI